MRKQLVVAPITLAAAFLLSDYVVMTYSSHNRRVVIPASIPHTSVHQEVPPAGVITGRVLNSEGRTVAQATVFAEREGFLSGIQPISITDEKGKFLIKGLRPGVYQVYASKEEDGYPLPISTFNMGNSVTEQKVVVSQDQTTEVVVNLATKGAKLTGRIVDATTAEPIQDARMTLRRVDNPKFYLMTGVNKRGIYKVLVPSDAFTIEVSAPNYQNKLVSSTLVVKGITKRLDISLLPIK